MYAKETAKRAFERLTGIGRPSRRETAARVRKRKAWPARFADDGLVPNNPKLPFVHYRSAVRYEEYEGSLSEHGRAVRMIPKVALPRRDPVYGAKGPLKRLWARKRSKGR
jgi:uncharacterized protein YjlB